MKHLKLFIIALFISITTTFAQDFTAQIVDAVTQEAIPYAAIQIDDATGTISNEEGVFTLDFEGKTVVNLMVSCLGYASKTISIEEVKANNYIIFMDEQVNELDEVFIGGEKPNIDSIMTRVRLNLKNNYTSGFKQHEVFYRASNSVDFKTLDFEVDKASSFKKKDHISVNNSLDSLSRIVSNSKAIQFSDYMGNIMVNDSNKAKLDVELATELLDKKNDLSVEGLQTKARNIMLKYLDENKYYKLKSGFFKIEDSLSLKKEFEEEAKRKDEHNTSWLRNSTNGLLSNTRFYDNSFLTKILNPKLYDYELLDLSFFNGEFIYVVDYKPKKAKSKFGGKLFISDESYAVIKAEYSYYKNKRGSKLNLKFLFGVKFVENIRIGTVIYKKDYDTEKYVPQYIKEEDGAYFYVKRPLKFLEVGSGRKSKVKFNFIVEGNSRSKEELLCINTKAINSNTYNAFKEAKKTPYRTLQTYDPSIWKNKNTLEPLEEMKKFNSN